MKFVNYVKKIDLEYRSLLTLISLYQILELYEYLYNDITYINIKSDVRKRIYTQVEYKRKLVTDSLSLLSILIFLSKFSLFS